MAAGKSDQSYQSEKKVQVNLRIRELQGELPQVVSDFIRSMIGHSSELTRLGYLYDLRLFLRYLCQEDVRFADTPVQLITPAQLGSLQLRDFERYTEYLSQYVRTDESGGEVTDAHGNPVFVTNREVGMARKLSAIRTFYKYMFTHGLIGENVTASMTMPKIHKKPVIFLNKEEIARLFDTVSTGEGLSERQKAYNENFRVRDIAIVSLLLGTGIRESELVGLDLRDVNLRDKTFLVTRKGGNEAVLHFNAQVAEALSDYLLQRKEIEPLPGHENAFFLSSQKKRISTRALQDLIKKYAQVAAPLKKRLSPHKMRSTFATNLYKNTHDIYLVSEALGHAQLETSTRYTAKEDNLIHAAENVDWVE